MDGQTEISGLLAFVVVRGNVSFFDVNGLIVDRLQEAWQSDVALFESGPIPVRGRLPRKCQRIPFRVEQAIVFPRKDVVGASMPCRVLPRQERNASR